ALGATLKEAEQPKPAQKKTSPPPAEVVKPADPPAKPGQRVDVLNDPVLDIIDEFKQKPAQSGPFMPEQLDALLRKGWQYLKDHPPELDQVLAATGKTVDQLREALSKPIKVVEVAKQEDFQNPGKFMRAFNLLEPIKDAEGKVIHGVGSTVYDRSFEKLGLKPELFNSWEVSTSEYAAAKRNRTTGEILTDLDHDSIPGNGERGFVDNDGNFLT